MSQLQVHDTYNMRFLDGLSTKDGKSVKYGVLLRSGNLDKLSNASQQKLVDYGVKTIIDLRDEWETELYPNVFEESDSVTYHNLPLIGDELSHDSDWQSATQNYVELYELYNQYIDGCQKQIAQIISTIAESEGTIVVHCYAGKDRTGIIVTLVLASLGVSDDIIAADYALSFQQIQHLVQEWRDYAIKNGRDLEQLERDAGSLPETILQMLAHLRARFGSVTDYLHHCGVSIAQINKLKSTFIQE